MDSRWGFSKRSAERIWRDLYRIEGCPAHAHPLPREGIEGMTAMRPVGSMASTRQPTFYGSFKARVHDTGMFYELKYDVGANHEPYESKLEYDSPSKRAGSKTRIAV